VAVPALLLAVFLMLVARPVAVWISLAAFRFSRQEMAFVSWVGLRGAVSIMLAILPIIAGLPNGRVMFNVAFVVVLASLLVQGWTIGPMARFLGLIVPGRTGPVDRIELELPGSSAYEIVAYVVHPESAVAKGQRIPRWARPSLVIRNGRTLRPHRAGRPQAGDQIYVITTPDYISLLDRLFAGRAVGADDPHLYGDFALEAETRLADMARVYPIELTPGDAQLTAAQFLRRELSGDIEPGDRAPLGAVDIIVRRVSETHEIEEVGLALEHGRAARPRIPVFQTPKELVELLRRWRGRNRGKPGKIAADGKPEGEKAEEGEAP
jgi:cell volume regulation protein A